MPHDKLSDWFPIIDVSLLLGDKRKACKVQSFNDFCDFSCDEQELADNLQQIPAVPKPVEGSRLGQSLEGNVQNVAVFYVRWATVDTDQFWCTMCTRACKAALARWLLASCSAHFGSQTICFLAANENG